MDSTQETTIIMSSSVNNGIPSNTVPVLYELRNKGGFYVVEPTRSSERQYLNHAALTGNASPSNGTYKLVTIPNSRAGIRTVMSVDKPEGAIFKVPATASKSDTVKKVRMSTISKRVPLVNFGNCSKFVPIPPSTQSKVLPVSSSSTASSVPPSTSTSGSNNGLKSKSILESMLSSAPIASNDETVASLSTPVRSQDTSKSSGILGSDSQLKKSTGVPKDDISSNILEPPPKRMRLSKNDFSQRKAVLSFERGTTRLAVMEFRTVTMVDIGIQVFMPDIEPEAKDNSESDETSSSSAVPTKKPGSFTPPVPATVRLPLNGNKLVFLNPPQGVKKSVITPTTLLNARQGLKTFVVGKNQVVPVNRNTLESPDPPNIPKLALRTNPLNSVKAPIYLRQLSLSEAAQLSESKTAAVTAVSSISSQTKTCPSAASSIPSDFSVLSQNSESPSCVFVAPSNPMSIPMKSFVQTPSVAPNSIKLPLNSSIKLNDSLGKSYYLPRSDPVLKTVQSNDGSLTLPVNSPCATSSSSSPSNTTNPEPTSPTTNPIYFLLPDTAKNALADFNGILEPDNGPSCPPLHRFRFKAPSQEKLQSTTVSSPCTTSSFTSPSNTINPEPTSPLTNPIYFLLPDTAKNASADFNGTLEPDSGPSYPPFQRFRFKAPSLEKPQSPPVVKTVLNNHGSLILPVNSPSSTSSFSIPSSSTSTLAPPKTKPVNVIQIDSVNRDNGKAGKDLVLDHEMSLSSSTQFGKLITHCTNVQNGPAMKSIPKINTTVVVAEASKVASVQKRVDNALFETRQTSDASVLTASNICREEVHDNTSQKLTITSQAGVGSNILKDLSSIQQNSNTTVWNSLNTSMTSKPSGTSNLSSMEDMKKCVKSAFSDFKQCLSINSDGNLPIHVAVENNDYAAVKRQCLVLKARKASINIPNSKDETPLQLALYYGHSSIVVMLLQQGADATVVDSEGNTSLHLAVAHADDNALQALLQSKQLNTKFINLMNDEGFTALHLAAQHNKVHAISLLAKSGAEVDKPDGKSGRTALFHAMERKNLEAEKFLKYLRAEMRGNIFTRPSTLQTTQNDASAKVAGSQQTIVAEVMDTETFLKCHQIKQVK